ncbi:alpha-mannosidase [Enterococcus faecium]|nr:alpha-mannosidase [Enterococcus faecium]
MQKCRKPFSQNFSYYSKLSDFFTTSDSRCSKACICGNKPKQTKNMRSYFCLAVLIT